jgi:hypothetical protein
LTAGAATGNVSNRPFLSLRLGDLAQITAGGCRCIQQSSHQQQQQQQQRLQQQYHYPQPQPEKPTARATTRIKLMNDHLNMPTAVDYKIYSEIADVFW